MEIVCFLSVKAAFQLCGVWTVVRTFSSFHCFSGPQLLLRVMSNRLSFPSAKPSPAAQPHMRTHEKCRVLSSIPDLLTQELRVGPQRSAF